MTGSEILILKIFIVYSMIGFVIINYHLMKNPEIKNEHDLFELFVIIVVVTFGWIFLSMNELFKFIRKKVTKKK